MAGGATTKVKVAQQQQPNDWETINDWETVSGRPPAAAGTAPGGQNFGLVPPVGFQRPERVDLPPDLMERIGHTALESLPYLGATAGALLAPEVSVPFGTFALGVGAAGAGAGVGSLAERGIRSVGDLPQPETTLGEDVLYKGVLPEAGGRVLTGTLSRVLGPLFKSSKLYQSGLKPVGSAESAERAVNAGVREGIVLDEQATAKTAAKIGKLNTEIESVINASPTNIAPDQYVKNVTGRFDKLRAKWSKDATGGEKFVDAIDEMERQFLINHGNVQPLHSITKSGKIVTIEPADMSLQELRNRAQPLSTGDAQAIKKQTYETIRTGNAKAWDNGIHPGLSVRANKEIARAMREELATIYPELNKLNAREGALIELEGQIKRYLKREGNKQITPYFIFPVIGGALGALGGGMGGAAGGIGAGALAAHLMRSALEDPAVKSRLAIALYKAGQTAIGKAAVKAAPYAAQAGIRATMLGNDEADRQAKISPLQERGIQVTIPPVR